MCSLLSASCGYFLVSIKHHLLFPYKSIFAIWKAVNTQFVQNPVTILPWKAFQMLSRMDFIPRTLRGARCYSTLFHSRWMESAPIYRDSMDKYMDSQIRRLRISHSEGLKKISFEGPTTALHNLTIDLIHWGPHNPTKL